jgi:hypothetical protein
MQGVGFEPTRISPFRLERNALTTWLSLLYVLYRVLFLRCFFIIMRICAFAGDAPTENRTQINRLEGDYSTIKLSALCREWGSNPRGSLQGVF